MSKIPQIILWSLLYSKYAAGVFPRVWYMCVNLLSLSSVAFNLAPLHSLALGGTPEIICLWDVAMLLIFMSYFRWPFGYTLFMACKDSCRMDKREELIWGALAWHFLPPHLQASFCCCLLHVVVDFPPVVTLQGWATQLSASPSCPFFCHLCLFS